MQTLAALAKSPGFPFTPSEIGATMFVSVARSRVARRRSPVWSRQCRLDLRSSDGTQGGVAIGAGPLARRQDRGCRPYRHHRPFLGSRYRPLRVHQVRSHIAIMCGRVIQSSAPVRLAIVEGMDARDSRVHNYPPRWNGAPSQDLLVIRRNRRTGDFPYGGKWRRSAAPFSRIERVRMMHRGGSPRRQLRL